MNVIARCWTRAKNRCFIVTEGGNSKPPRPQ